ncbi:6921_t:CDS:2 [Ambispora gerdemannii]|uniref:6921_t:CDS:1 n=1 Tax=Ambispora gerdemannii TaxID=144530 RepID=A0A9N8WN11_9GLOM|nr:6921_t:CDS:2 [Ambispora gerdemannii]
MDFGDDDGQIVHVVENGTTDIDSVKGVAIGIDRFDLTIQKPYILTALPPNPIVETIEKLVIKTVFAFSTLISLHLAGGSIFMLVKHGYIIIPAKVFLYMFLCFDIALRISVGGYALYIGTIDDGFQWGLFFSLLFFIGKEDLVNFIEEYRSASMWDIYTFLNSALALVAYVLIFLESECAIGTQCYFITSSLLAAACATCAKCLWVLLWFHFDKEF